MVGEVETLARGHLEDIAFSENPFSDDGLGRVEDLDLNFETEGDAEVALLCPHFFDEVIAVVVLCEVELD